MRLSGHFLQRVLVTLALLVLLHEPVVLALVLSLLVTHQFAAAHFVSQNCAVLLVQGIYFVISGKLGFYLLCECLVLRLRLHNFGVRLGVQNGAFSQGDLLGQASQPFLLVLLLLLHSSEVAFDHVCILLAFVPHTFQVFLAQLDHQLQCDRILFNHLLEFFDGRVDWLIVACQHRGVNQPACLSQKHTVVVILPLLLDLQSPF
jgi:hypothetical protein